MTTLQEEVEAQVRDAASDFPDLGETDLFHAAAYNICADHYYGGDRAAANEYWQAHYGETFSARLRRPL